MYLQVSEKVVYGLTYVAQYILDILMVSGKEVIFRFYFEEFTFQEVHPRFRLLLTLLYSTYHNFQGLSP